MIPHIAPRSIAAGKQHVDLRGLAAADALVAHDMLLKRHDAARRAGDFLDAILALAAAAPHGRGEAVLVFDRVAQFIHIFRGEDLAVAHGAGLFEKIALDLIEKLFDALGDAVDGQRGFFEPCES